MCGVVIGFINGVVKITVFQDVMTCIMVEFYESLSGTCSHHQLRQCVPSIWVLRISGTF